MSRMILSLMFALAITGPAPAATISIQPDPLAIAPGATAWASIVAHNLGGAAIGGFDLTLLYPDTLAISSPPEFGPFLGTPDLDSLTLSTIGPGQLRLLEVSFLSEGDLRALQPDTFTLARIPFSTSSPVAEGTLQIQGMLADGAGSPIDVVFDNASIVSGVPEPSSAALTGIALIAVLLIGGYSHSSTRTLGG